MIKNTILVLLLVSSFTLSAKDINFISEPNEVEASNSEKN